MPKSSTRIARPNAARAWRLYVVGQVLVLVGAGSINASGSMLPMALASSAALMLTMPLVSHLWRSRRR